MAARWLSVIPQNSLILAACSGGADSTFLAHYLRETLQETGHRLELVHVNHRTRGTGSDEDEQFVRDLAKTLDVPCHVKRFHGRPAASDENALRLGRLILLKEAAAENRAGVLAFGHQREDLAETFLLMALRGSGPAGLEGMREVRRVGNLIFLRPLLGMTRAEIEEELQIRNQAWKTDPTNKDEGYRRNFLRHRVIPLLNEIEPAAIRKLADSAEICGEMRTAEEIHLAPVLDKAILYQGASEVLFDSALLRENCDISVLPGVIRSFAARLTTERDLDMPFTFGRPALHSIADRIKRSGDESFFGNKPWLWLSNRFGLISFEDDFPKAFWQSRSGFPFIVMSEEEVVKINDSLMPTEERKAYTVADWKMDLAVHNKEDGLTEEPPGGFSAGIDMDAVIGKLYLGIAEDEDRVYFASGSKSVRECLKEAGVPSLLRSHVGALYDDQGVLWIPGIRQDARALVTDETKQVLRCRFQKK